MTIQCLDNALLPDRFKIKFETYLPVCAFDDHTVKNLDTLFAMKTIYYTWDLLQIIVINMLGEMKN